MTLRLRTDDLEWREIDSDVVILDGRDAAYLTLNGLGALLWRMLAASATSDELVGALLDAYEVEESIAAADTDAFLGRSQSKGCSPREKAARMSPLCALHGGLRAALRTARARAGAQGKSGISTCRPAPTAGVGHPGRRRPAPPAAAHVPRACPRVGSDGCSHRRSAGRSPSASPRPRIGFTGPRVAGRRGRSAGAQLS